MTPRELIRITSDRFRRAGIPDPETDAALLLSHLTGRPHLELRLDLQAELLPETVDTFLALADKRLEHVPLQYLLGQCLYVMLLPFHTVKVALLGMCAVADIRLRLIGVKGDLLPRFQMNAAPIHRLGGRQGHAANDIIELMEPFHV